LLLAAERVSRPEEPMAYRELTMIDVREVLRRWQAGQGLRRIARESGLDRKTVRRYQEAAEQSGVESSSELTDELVHQSSCQWGLS
jgi:predicted transcriptional regulator